MRLNEYSDWGELIRTSTRNEPRFPIDEAQVMTYDGLSRLISQEQLKDGVKVPGTRYDYDYDTGFQAHPALPMGNSLGQMTRARAATSTVYFGYDAFGHPVATAHEDPDGKFYLQTARFDADGLPTQVGALLPDTGHELERMTYAYDSARRLIAADFVDQHQVAHPFYAVEYRDALGRVREAKIAGATFSADYADEGRRLLHKLEVESPSGAQWGLSQFKFDPLGRELKRSERKSGGEQAMAYEYDPLGRLVSSMREGNGAVLERQVFSYDALGNLTEKLDALGAQTVQLTYRDTDNLDRLCSVGYQGAVPSAACDVQHDPLGRIVKQPTPQGTREVSYLPSGAVSRIQQSGTTATLQYGPFGEVQALDIAGPTTDPRHDRRYGPFELRSTEDGTVLTRTFGMDGITASRRGPGEDWVFALAELRGSRLFLDQHGEPVQQVDYDAYGKSTSEGVAPTSKRYSREQWNGGDHLAALGLAHLGARMYDPIVGRFLSPDPLMSATSPYSFANNDPINLADPSGLAPEGESEPPPPPEPENDPRACPTPQACEEVIEVSSNSPATDSSIFLFNFMIDELNLYTEEAVNVMNAASEKVRRSTRLVRVIPRGWRKTAAVFGADAMLRSELPNGVPQQIPCGPTAFVLS